MQQFKFKLITNDRLVGLFEFEDGAGDFDEKEPYSWLHLKMEVFHPFTKNRLNSFSLGQSHVKIVSHVFLTILLWQVQVVRLPHY